MRNTRIRTEAAEVNTVSTQINLEFRMWLWVTRRNRKTHTPYNKI